MRKLAKNESQLLLIFGAAIFLAVNLFLIRAWLSHRSSVADKISAAASAISISSSWITAAEVLQPARDWMQEHPSPFKKTDAANTDLLNTVRTLAEKSGLKIAEETLLPGEEADGSRVALLQSKITGPFSGVATFLFELQNPTAWRSVEKMIIRSDNEPPNVIVEMEIRQYFRSSESVTNETVSE